MTGATETAGGAGGFQGVKGDGKIDRGEWYDWCANRFNIGLDILRLPIAFAPLLSSLLVLLFLMYASFMPPYDDVCTLR